MTLERALATAVPTDQQSITTSTLERKPSTSTTTTDRRSQTLPPGTPLSSASSSTRRSSTIKSTTSQSEKNTSTKAASDRTSQVRSSDWASSVSIDGSTQCRSKVTSSFRGNSGSNEEWAASRNTANGDQNSSFTKSIDRLRPPSSSLYRQSSCYSNFSNTSNNNNYDSSSNNRYEKRSKSSSSPLNFEKNNNSINNKYISNNTRYNSTPRNRNSTALERLNSERSDRSRSDLVAPATPSSKSANSDRFLYNNEKALSTPRRRNSERLRYEQPSSPSLYPSPIPTYPRTAPPTPSGTREVVLEFPPMPKSKSKEKSAVGRRTEKERGKDRILAASVGENLNTSCNNDAVLKGAQSMPGLNEPNSTPGRRNKSSDNKGLKKESKSCNFLFFFRRKKSRQDRSPSPESRENRPEHRRERNNQHHSSSDNNSKNNLYQQRSASTGSGDDSNHQHHHRYHRKDPNKSRSRGRSDRKSKNPNSSKDERHRSRSKDKDEWDRLRANSSSFAELPPHPSFHSSPARPLQQQQQNNQQSKPADQSHSSNSNGRSDRLYLPNPATNGRSRADTPVTRETGRDSAGPSRTSCHTPVSRTQSDEKASRQYERSSNSQSPHATKRSAGGKSTNGAGSTSATDPRRGSVSRPVTPSSNQRLAVENSGFGGSASNFFESAGATSGSGVLYKEKSFHSASRTDLGPSEGSPSRHELNRSDQNGSRDDLAGKSVQSASKVDLRSASKTDLEEESQYQYTESSAEHSRRSSKRSQSLPNFSERFQSDPDNRVINDAEDFEYSPTPDMFRGALNLSFCGCGFLGMYHLGVVSVLVQRAPSLLERVEKVGGASAGALMAAVLVTASDRLEESGEHIHSLAKEIRRKPLGALTPGYSFTRSLRTMLDDILPEDAHHTARNKLYVSLTNAATKKNEMFCDFKSRDEMIEALVASCYIPVYAGMKIPVIRGKKYYDGGLSVNLPKFEKGRTITVSPFDSRTDIHPKQGQEAEKKAHFINIHNQDIQALDLSSEQVSMKNIKRGAHAFFPPRRGVLQDYYNKGRYDASRFLIREGLYEINYQQQSKSVLYESSV